MASSSKKKSSSKNKDSKLSSKSKKIKKSNRNASKKIGRRHDSSSEDSISLQAVTAQSSDSSSENESTSLVSSSSSEGTHRSRRKGSRLKKRDKSKASKRSSSKEELSRGKKRKRSKKKKKGHHESRKKSSKKKHRSRRHASVSSDDDDSSSSTSEENGIQGKRTKVKEKKRRIVESKTETILDKSPEGSSNSRSSDPSYRDSQVGENLVGENNSRRLKSVIFVVVKPDEEEENMLEKDSVNGKAVGDDLDGIHPSHSLDTSNRSKRDLPPHSPLASDRKRTKDFSDGNRSLITPRASAPLEHIKAVGGDLGGIHASHSLDTSNMSSRDPPPHSPLASDRKRTKDFSDGNSSLITPRASEPLEHIKTDFAPSNIQYPLHEEHRNETEQNYSGPILPDDSPGENDLESVLRRKALENLKKFRRKVETDVKTTGNESVKDDDNVDQLSTGKDVVVRRQSPESGGSNIIKKNMHEVKKDGVNTNKPTTAFKKDNFSWRRVPEQLSSKVTDNAIINESMKPPFKRDDPRSSMSVQQNPDKRTEAVKVKAVDPLDTPVLSRNPIKEHGYSQAFDAKSESSDNLLHKSKHSGMQKTTIKVNAVDPLDTSVLSRNPIKEHGSSKAFNAKSESSDNLLHKSKHSGMPKTTVKVNAVDPLDTSVLSRNPIKEHGSSQAFKAKSESSDNLLHKTKHSGMQKTTNMSPDKETIANKVNEAHTADEANRGTSPISTDDHQGEFIDVGVRSSATGYLSNDQENEAKEGSDFKEKKMSVMRGGEMVEVSYKVYIPQRAAALARRKLKR